MIRTLLIVLSVLVLAAGGLFVWKSGSFNQKKRVLFVDSYHEGYPWSDGIAAGILGALEGQEVEVFVHRMDTKNNKGEEFMVQAGRKAKEAIDSFKPDVVIAADDNAQKYLIVPFYRGTDLPVVFAGVNWDASGYGYPAPNVTGMVEVEVPTRLFEILRKFAKGDRIAMIGTNTASNRKSIEKYAQLLNIRFDKEIYVDTFDEWREAYLEMQAEVDILFLYNNAGIEGWDDAQASAFVQKHAKIPSGSVSPWMAPFVMVTNSKDATEQGEWAAKTALRVLNGESPGNIPIVRNRRGEMIVNSRLANQLGVEVPPELLSGASQIYR